MSDIRITVTGAGGFIGGSLVRYFADRGFHRIRAVDKKPVGQWYQRTPGVESLCLDVSKENDCRRACEGADEVYNLAADMGGMGFIENFHIECMRNGLIATNMLEAAYQSGVERFFFSSSACVYNTALQSSPGCQPLKETDAYPALSERGYGWEKLLSEMFCQEYWAERGMKTFIARFFNIYGPHGSWNDGREKAPAALCRKVATAKLTGSDTLEIWGDGTRTRNFTYISDCLAGIDAITHCDDLIATPVNLGSSEQVTVNELATLAEEAAGVRLQRIYQPDAPKGVVGRNTDNTFIKSVLGWEPRYPLRDGMAATYGWIEQLVAETTGCKR